MVSLVELSSLKFALVGSDSQRSISIGSPPSNAAVMLAV
jgi:hypothetical protein